jgi:hypothetical protein
VTGTAVGLAVPLSGTGHRVRTGNVTGLVPPTDADRLLRAYRERRLPTWLHAPAGSQGGRPGLIARSIAKALAFAEKVAAGTGRCQSVGTDVRRGLPVPERRHRRSAGPAGARASASTFGGACRCQSVGTDVRRGLPVGFAGDGPAPGFDTCAAG